MRKQSVYLPADLLAEVESEGRRLDRSTSWMLHRAWQVARRELRAAPSAPEPQAKEEPHAEVSPAPPPRSRVLRGHRP